MHGKRRRRGSTEPEISLITVRPRAERDVVLRLRKRGIASYSPRLLEFCHNGNVEQPLFPGYVFVWISGTETWGDVRGTIGVGGFVKLSGSPVRVRSEIVESIRSCENGYGYVVLERKFQIGDAVRVGGDAGCLGIVQGYGPRRRVDVLLRILGREVVMGVSEGGLVAA